MRYQIKNKRILIKPQLQDFDKTKSCHITAEQFRRVLKDCNILPPSEDLFQILIRKYFDKGNMRELNYLIFCHDIDRPEDLWKPYIPKNPVEDNGQLPGMLRDAGSTFFKDSTMGLDIISNRFLQKRIETFNNPLDIEVRLQAAVVMKRVRIEEFFFDFDKLRKGKVTANQFMSIISMLGFGLTSEELESLTTKYRTDDGMFNYKDFCATINSAFTTYGIQKDPLAVVKPVTVDLTIPARRKYLEMDDVQKQQMLDILNEYKQAIQIKRIHLKQMFQDFDITNNQHVTKYQFLRTLSQVGLSASDDILNLILKTYCDKGNADEVNYFDFCNDIDSPEQLFGVGRGYNHSFDYYPRNRPRITGKEIKRDLPEDVEDALAKLRQFCKEQRIRISEFFRDFDKLRSGYITQAQFRIGLSMAKITLSGAEFNLFVNQFAGPEKNQVRWRDFSDSVDEVFTKKGLEKQVDIVLDDARTQSLYGQALPTDEDHGLVDQLSQHFRELVIRERLDAKSFFQDHDRHNHFKVSPKQFKQILTLLKCPVDDNQIRAITRVYGNKLGDVEYLRFLADSECLNLGRALEGKGTKTTYVPIDIDFSGAKNMGILLDKIKEFVFRHRIRLGEFFQDHDPLRKGVIDATKFRTTLYA